MASTLLRSCAVSRIACATVRLPAVLGLRDHVPRRNHNQYRMRYLKEMYRKRLEVGPERERRRSEWINWNYDCEIYAFGKRLGEDFTDASLRQAFVHSSYLEGEKKKRAELGIDVESVPLQLEDNSELAEKGHELISTYLKVYLRNMYPYMFEEGICAVHDYLMTEETLSHIAKHIGCGDLILAEEFPVSKSILSVTFKAVVGALLEDKGKERAEGFVRDFILPQLVEKDVNELWEIVNPMGLLAAVLALSGRGEPESRLLWKSGASTIMSLYWVGIYSDKQLIAKSPGESLLIAEEMAAREAIKKVMKTEDSRPPLILGKMAENLNVDYGRVNLSAADVIKKHYENPKKNKDVSPS